MDFPRESIAPIGRAWMIRITTHVQVINNDAIPNPPVVNARRLVTVVSLKCDQTEDSGEDEISLFINIDGDFPFVKYGKL